MVTEVAYEFFRSMYEEEQQRFQRLVDRGKIYLSLVSLFFGGVFFKLDWIIDHRADIQPAIVIYGGGLLSFLAALGTIIWATQKPSYELPTDPVRLAEKLAAGADVDADFMQARVADYVVAYQRNSARNDTFERQLLISLALIGVGILLFVAGIAWILAAPPQK